MWPSLVDSFENKLCVGYCECFIAKVHAVNILCM